MRRTKKPTVRPQLRRDWLRRQEEEGLSAPKIATVDGFDVRTVRNNIEIAREERERREARSVVLRNAMEKHYDDLGIFARKLDSHITGETSSLLLLKEDPMWTALREHMPRSSLWRNLGRQEILREEVREVEKGLRRQLDSLVRNRAQLPFSVTHGELGLNTGIIDLLSSHFMFTARGEPGLDKRADFRLNAVDDETTSMEYGDFSIGKVPNERVDDVKHLVIDLMNDVTSWEEHGAIGNLFARLDRVKRELHDELLVIILRRVVPGRCRYCP